MNEENHDLLAPRETSILSAADVLRHVKLIEEVSQAVMKDGTHYGKIPGCGDKPTLLKPGAEKLLLTFGLSTAHRITQRDLGGGHREYEVVTTVQAGQRLLAEGVGVCSTMESKYRYRRGSRKCPTCSKERTLIQTKGGRNPGGYWCVPDKGGCGGNFQPNDKAIEGQVVGNVDNPELADVYNTVLKMAKKRSLVDGALTSTASSDFFAQDLEELEVKDAQFTVKEEAAAAAAPPAPAAESVPPTRRRASPPKPATTTVIDQPPPVEFLTQKPVTEAGAVLDEMVQQPASGSKAPTLPQETSRAAPSPAAATSSADLKSWRGLTLQEWQLLSEEQRSAAGDVSRKQCKLILDLAKSKGITDPDLVMKTLHDDFATEFNEWGVSQLWQVDSKIASFAINELKNSPF